MKSGFAAAAKHLILSIALIVATASVTEATPFVIDTDATWLARNSLPGVGWETSVAFDTVADGGWAAAQNNSSLPCGSFGCMIWWDGQFSTTEQVWLRKTFFLDGPIVSAFMVGGVDDDATIWINGNIVYNVFDGLAGSFSLNLAPFLAPGINLIAVFADDNLFWGRNHQFIARLTVDTATEAAVPEPSALVLLGSGLSILLARQLRRRRVTSL